MPTPNDLSTRAVFAVKPKYISAAVTRKLLARGASARAERLRACDMLSPTAAAEAAGVQVKTIRTWIAEGRVVALPVSRRSRRLPRWQFAQPLWSALPQLLNTLSATEPWRVLSFLETPLGGLSGLTPRQAIERGDLERVLALAAEES
jgi:hypothetical protein